MSTLRSLDSRAAPIAQAFVRILQSPTFARFAGVHKVSVTVTSTRRDRDEQQQLYDCFKRTGCSNCRRGPSCYPAAAPGHSTHALGIAMDLRLDPPVYTAAGTLWERLGFTWGGRFGDKIHFDFRPRK